MSWLRSIRRLIRGLRTAGTEEDEVLWSYPTRGTGVPHDFQHCGSLDEVLRHATVLRSLDWEFDHRSFIHTALVFGLDVPSGWILDAERNDWGDPTDLVDSCLAEAGQGVPAPIEASVEAVKTSLTQAIKKGDDPADWLHESWALLSALDYTHLPCLGFLHEADEFLAPGKPDDAEQARLRSIALTFLATPTDDLVNTARP